MLVNKSVVLSWIGQKMKQSQYSSLGSRTCCQDATTVFLLQEVCGFDVRASIEFNLKSITLL